MEINLFSLAVAETDYIFKEFMLISNFCYNASQWQGLTISCIKSAADLLFMHLGRKRLCESKVYGPRTRENESG